MSYAEPADRQAVERIIGQPLSQAWPREALPAGTRVKVVQGPEWAGPWQREFLGTVDAMAAPEPVSHTRAVPGELRYWIRFDEPQYEVSGSGPYRKASIWSRHLEAQ